jgi:1-aminocyclopropane-1-carboxylate deaminase/D-cysteine desulfhydrase-like pyridoxal-dependent ACC family enzyme
MTGLESLFSEPPELFVKREDLCGIGVGGNKARKLSALLTEAAAVQATVVITTGAVQSNHCAMTAVAAAIRGLRAELYLTGDDPGSRTGNLRVEEAAGAAITFLGACAEQERDDRIAARVAARLDDLLTVTREHHLPGLAARPNYRILGTQRGSGYGMATPASRKAARIAIRQDGLILDQTYTAKAMAGLIQGIRDGTYTRRDKVVFFHTGGLAGFFAEDNKELA